MEPDSRYSGEGDPVDHCYSVQKGMTEGEGLCGLLLSDARPDEGLREGPGKGAEIHARVEIIGNSSLLAQPSALVSS